MHVTLLYFQGCPNWTVADARLAALSDELDLPVAEASSTPAISSSGLRSRPPVVPSTPAAVSSARPAGTDLLRWHAGRFARTFIRQIATAAREDCQRP